MSRKKKMWYGNKERIMLCMVLVIMLFMLTGFGRMKQVQIVVDGRSMEVNTMYATPERILKQAGVTLEGKDAYRLSTDDVQKSTTITIYRAIPVTVEYQGKKQQIITSQPTVGEVLSELGYGGDAYTATPDKNTTTQRNLNIQVQDAVQTDTEEQDMEGRKDQRTVQTSRGAMRFHRMVYMEATAYLPSDGGGSGITASGMAARHGVVSVDPDVIPLGTRLYIPGYGMAVAADTGGAINGERIDLCMEDYTDAINFGRRDVEVYILD